MMFTAEKPYFIEEKQNIMADPKTKRMRPVVLQENITSGDAINGLSDYDPANQDFRQDLIQAARLDMEAKQAKETVDYGVYQASRDAAVAAEWKYNDMIRGGRTQVKAQYGENSDELQKVGLKKKSEYKSRTRKPKPTT